MTDPDPDDLTSRVQQLLLGEDSLAFFANEMARLGPSAVPVVIGMARESQRDIKFKERALLMLGTIGGDEATAFVASQLGEKHEMVKAAALSALRQIGDVTHSPAVSMLLDDESTVVRKEAIKTLAALGDSASLVPLNALAKSEGQSFLNEQAQQAIKKIESRSF